jgi:mannose-1-phosphate guanylyltransferase
MNQEANSQSMKFKLHTIKPVILCGGSGTRLWSLSRESIPKKMALMIDDNINFSKENKLIGVRSKELTVA